MEKVCNLAFPFWQLKENTRLIFVSSRSVSHCGNGIETQSFEIEYHVCSRSGLLIE